MGVQDIKKASDLARREVLYNILIGFVVPMKLVKGKGKVVHVLN
jgi:hypothetical protein